MVQPATQHFTTLTTGKEATAGTSVATTKEWYGDGTGELNVDPMLSLHGGNRGTMTSIAHATSKGEAVNISFNTDADNGYPFDYLPLIFGQIDTGNSGTGGAADKTWTIAPAQTTADAPEAYTIEVADDVQAWECTYSVARSFTIGASMDSMTTGSVDWFARSAVKVTQTAVAANTNVYIPGYLWIPKFATAQSGLAGASGQTNFLRSWQATYTTGWVPRFYQDGLTWFGQAVKAADLTAELTMTVDATALAVSEFYDKFRAQTVSFIQLNAVSPVVLGGSFYSAQLSFAVIYTDVKPIASEEDGVNLYQITAQSAYDSTWTNSMGAVIVCSTATIT